MFNVPGSDSEEEDENEEETTEADVRIKQILKIEQLLSNSYYHPIIDTTRLLTNIFISYFGYSY